MRPDPVFGPTPCSAPRLGVAPGDKDGSDPQALIQQEYTSPTPNGGFLQIAAGDELVMAHFDSRGKQLHRVSR